MKISENQMSDEYHEFRIRNSNGDYDSYNNVEV
jgi:hypothetical protein